MLNIIRPGLRLLLCSRRYLCSGKSKIESSTPLSPTTLLATALRTGQLTLKHNDESINIPVQDFSAHQSTSHSNSAGRRELIDAEIQRVNGELQPLEQQINKLFEKSEKQTDRILWLGLFGMGAQFGVLARLTWWEYSWDIMEPVTYFVTYGTSAMLMYIYFLITRVHYDYPTAKTRTQLRRFYATAKRGNFDIESYNRLKTDLATLTRLRKQEQLNKPVLPKPN